MTRFARSKGAAASNERVEEEATPWHQMVKPIRDSNSNKSTGANRDVEDLDGDMADPSIDDDSHQDHSSTTQIIEMPSNLQEENSSDEDDYDIKDETNENSVNGLNKELEVTKLHEKDESGTKKKRQRKQNKCLNCKKKGHLKRDCPDLPEERRKELQELVEMKIERKGKGTGRKKNKRKLPDETESSENADSAQNKSAKYEKSHTNPQKGSNIKGSNFDNQAGRGKKDKHKKVLTDLTGQVVGEGEGLFQGFRVQKKDVKRLQILQKELRTDKSLKQEDVNATLKRERRKAERQLATYHKMVCYSCRKPGHLVSDCPDTNLSTKDTGSKKDVKTKTHCFKCGEENHTSRDCVSKLKGADAFRFAVCFICKEVGHLAKSCPDNPKGLYPKGGGCKFCGSVEHLKSDCTRKAEKDKRQEVTLNTCGTMRNKKLGIEEVETPASKSKQKVDVKKLKVVAF